MKLPLDPRLPIISDDKLRPLTQRLYELFRQLSVNINALEETVSALSGGGGGGGGGSTLSTGTATIDFGTGSNLATVAVTGQTSILSTSSVWLELVADVSGSHTAQDAAYAALFISLTASSPSAGTGFTIYAACAEQMSGTFKVRWTWS
jgi:hypothetical protein